MGSVCRGHRQGSGSVFRARSQFLGLRVRVSFRGHCQGSVSGVEVGVQGSVLVVGVSFQGQFWGWYGIRVRGQHQAPSVDFRFHSLALSLHLLGVSILCLRVSMKCDDI